MSDKDFNEIHNGLMEISKKLDDMNDKMDKRLDELSAKIDKNTDTTNKILDQVEKTNGVVSQHEERLDTMANKINTLEAPQRFSESKLNILKRMLYRIMNKKNDERKANKSTRKPKS